MTATAANPTIVSAPAVATASSLGASIRVEQLTCEVGDLNPASGYGEWPDAEILIRELANSEMDEIARAVAALGAD